MKQAVFEVDVSRQMLADSSLIVPSLVTIPDEVRGPRGGRYKPVGPWQITWSETPRWDQNLVTVQYRSAGVRYIRPDR